MTEAPEFEGPLRNPDVSEEADRGWDKTTERLPAEAARRLIPEFAELDKTQKIDKRYQTAAEKRLPHAQAILENARKSGEERRARESRVEDERLEDSVELMRGTYTRPDETEPGTDSN